MHDEQAFFDNLTVYRKDLGGSQEALLYVETYIKNMMELLRIGNTISFRGKLIENIKDLKTEIEQICSDLHADIDFEKLLKSVEG